jgi:hypothetical protein
MALVSRESQVRNVTRSVKKKDYLKSMVRSDVYADTVDVTTSAKFKF